MNGSREYLQKLDFCSNLMWVRRIGHIALVPMKGFESLCYLGPYLCVYFSSGYPQAAAAHVALSTVRNFLEENPGLVRCIDVSTLATA
jgi:hypothetical protein